jgi:hypothetical protein
MSIKFVCRCGKRLRARDEMAARRSLCPRCGQPVGIPSLRPTQTGTEAHPLTPAERILRRRNVPPGAPTPPPVPTAGPITAPPRGDDRRCDELYAPPVQPIDPGTVRRVLVRRKPTGRGWPLERRWYHCLAYPVRALPLLMVLAAALTVVTGCGVRLWAELLRVFDDTGLHLAAIAGLVVFFLLASYACGVLECVLASAMAGDGRYLAWPGRDLGLVVRSGLAFLVCSLAGPVVPAFGAVWFALHCGDPAAADWLILWELGALAAGYGMLAVVAVTRGGRLRYANPLRVAELLDHLGWRAFVVAFLASALMLAGALVGLRALDEIQRQAGTGWLLLAACWTVALAGSTFLFRLLGFWCYHRGVGAPRR